MLALKIGAAVFAATLVLAPAVTFADQGGQPNSHAKANMHAHAHSGYDPQMTKGNDGTCGSECAGGEETEEVAPATEEVAPAAR